MIKSVIRSTLKEAGAMFQSRFVVKQDQVTFPRIQRTDFHSDPFATKEAEKMEYIGKNESKI